MELLLFLVSRQNQSTEIVTGQDTIINSSRLYYCSERLFLQCSKTLEPMGGFRHIRSHFGVVFHVQSNGEVTVQIS